MGAFFETIPKSLIPWILEQKVIWIASAPLAADGHVNISPKGGHYFGVIDEKTFWVRNVQRERSRRTTCFIWKKIDFSLLRPAKDRILADTPGASIKISQVNLFLQ